MSEEDEKATKPYPSGGTPESLPPFVPNDDSANCIRRIAAAGALVANTEVFPPLIGKGVRYIDFGFTSTRELWTEIVEPAHERFANDRTRGNAIMAFLALSLLPDWLWHELHPGQDTRGKSKEYDQFRQQLFGDCPELAWVRDVADAGKHRGLGRPDVKVREAAKTWPNNTLPLKIILDDGSEHDIADVLLRIVDYYRKRHFRRETEKESHQDSSQAPTSAPTINHVTRHGSAAN